MSDKNTALNFTKDISLILQSRNITLEQFSNDIKKGNKNSEFENKYPELFDGTIRAFGSRSKKSTPESRFNSFSGSYRRSLNENNFSDNPNIRKLQETQRKYYIKPTTISKAPKRNVKKISKKELKELNKTLDLYEIDDNKILNWLSRFKNAWNIKLLKENFNQQFQAVNIIIEYDVVDENDNIIWFSERSSVSSGYSRKAHFKTLYYRALDNLEAFIENIKKKYGFVNINSVQIKIIRTGA